MRLRLLLPLLLALPTACSAAPAGTFPSKAGPLQVTEVARGLQNPWALAFLPDGRMLVTERTGRLRLVSAQGQIGPAIAGLPKVVARGQGGLMDVLPARDFARSGLVYLSYSEPRGSETNGTSVLRARLKSTGTDGSLEDATVIFRQEPAVDSGHHFGSRLVWARDGTLFVSLGDRGSERDRAQTLDNHIGKLLRITADGGAPADNPFVNRPDAKPEIWSYGHRNQQGAALHPVSGAIWTHEHGPQGGDEVNAPKPGRNYGWPVITYGREYSGEKVGEGISRRDGLEQPLHYWVPSIAPSGMAFYSHDRVPAWKGNLFVASLKFGQLSRLVLDGETVTGEERLLEGFNRRLRDVRQGPDGALYLLTDEGAGAILRLVPAGRG